MNLPTPLAHVRGLNYPIGTRYSNSGTYDEATAEISHGWQVFEQRRADGTSTGRRSFVNNSGMLCGIQIAEAERARAIRDAAPDLLAALALIVRGYGVTFQDATLRNLAVDAIAKAAGCLE